MKRFCRHNEKELLLCQKGVLSLSVEPCENRSESATIGEPLRGGKVAADFAVFSLCLFDRRPENAHHQPLYEPHTFVAQSARQAENMELLGLFCGKVLFQRSSISCRSAGIAPVAKIPPLFSRQEGSCCLNQPISLTLCKAGEKE